jgi:ABC-2 type transport system ATP-binding protein
MIEVKQLKFKFDAVFAEDISFQVEKGEIYFILCKEEAFRSHFFELMRGYRKPFTGDIIIGGRSVTDRQNHSNVAFINMIDEVSDFETDVSMGQFVDYVCSMVKIDKLKVFEHLIRLNVDESCLKHRIKEERSDIFKMVYLSILLGMDTDYIVFNNFVNVEDKIVQVEFNKTMLRKRDEGKAILYLTSDIFYAFQVADKVSFIKSGYMAPAAPLISADFRDMDVMKLYKQYMI